MDDSVVKTPYDAQHDVQSIPSTIVKFHTKQITIDGKSYELILVIMKRSFLLAIKAAQSFPRGPPLLVVEDGCEANMSEAALIQSFMAADPPLRGLSLAIGDTSTCLMPAENSVASSSLAIRLSKKLNHNQPVYVASDIQPPNDTCNVTDFMSKFYLKTFQFVGSHYQGSVQTT